MPYYSDLSNNMYYSGMPSYSSASSYGYSGSSSPLGVSYSASYLNPGGSYSTHSSLGGYGRAPLSSRWTSTGRTYSPLLSTISERGTSSPVRINSPRRISLTNKKYSSTNYSPRPISINTADIDVSRDKYRAKHTLNKPPISPTASVSSEVKHGGINNSDDNSPFMPRVDGKPETGIDSSPGQRSTIHRGRTVVRLYTVKRRERDSPRKPQDVQNSNQNDISTKDINSAAVVEAKNIEKIEKDVNLKNKSAETFALKKKNRKRTTTEKHVEKFKSKDESGVDDVTLDKQCANTENIEMCSEKSTILTPASASNTALTRSPDRRCSMELLAEQATLLDSLIRNENLSTATIDLSKLGTKDDKSPIFNFNTNIVESNVNKVPNRLQTTKSDHSLHNRLASSIDSKEIQNFPKRRSLKKSYSGGNIRRLDSITEFAKESLQSELPIIEENRLSCKLETIKTKPKLKPKITSSVDTSQPTSPLKFRIENITVEEKIKVPKKEIIFSSAVDIPNEESKQSSSVNEANNDICKNKIITKKTQSVLEKRTSIESSPEDCDFWDKIGKRETIYIKNRKEKIENDILRHRREIFWSPEDEFEIDKINEQNGDVDVSSQKIEQKYFNISNASSDATEKCKVIEVQVNDNDNINLEILTPENIRKEAIMLSVDEKDQFDLKGRNFRQIIENNLNTPLNDIVEKHCASVQDLNVNYNTTVKNDENDLRIDCEMFTSLDKSVQESCTSHDFVKKESETEATTTSKTEAGSNTVTDMSEQTSSLEKKMHKQKIIYSIMEPTKRNPVNTVTFNLQLCNAKISIIHDERSSNKKQMPFLASSKRTEVEHVPNGPVLDEVVVEEDKVGKNLDVSTKASDISQLEVVTKSTVENIPHKESSLHENNTMATEETGETNKADNEVTKNENTNVINVSNELSEKCIIQLPTSPKKRPVKDEPALKPLIATPRPLQKKNPQIIHSSTSSESSSEEESSEDDDDADKSDESEECTQFYDCENNPDGRTSTGSNDSGFDSSAPTSPAGFVFIKKDCDVNCHRKCEKLTANLCGVNQRLLAEALASRSSRRGGENPGASGSGGASSKPTANDIFEQELEASTAYGLFRRTGRFTPPARSIPRFRKYTIDDFHFIKVLGKGSFGKVLLAELRDTEYYYAVKCLKKDVVLEDDDVECTLIERKVLALGTNHPYLCHLFATFQTDSHLFFVMEYLNGGDLMFHIQQSGRFPEARARFYAAEIVSGLKFLHKRGIVYRDLKLDNILLDYEGHVRIADFGMCKLQIYLDKTADTFCGTPDYMAPEIIKGLKYNQAVDWWSFGVLVYEMLIGQSPFSGCDEDELFWSICNEMPSYPRFLSTEALTVLTRLLDKDASTRLGGAECMHGDIRDQDFFRSIHWDRLERRELETPFKPRVRHPLDTQYFDRAFTGERPRLTAVEPQVLRSMDQEPFRGFSYTNPNATDH